MRKRRDAVTERNMIEAAKNYAASDASDPWTFARAMTHLRNGVADFANAHGQEAYYSADIDRELRKLPDGTEYYATVYRNRFRP